jgi:hypothetical protein
LITLKTRERTKILKVLEKEDLTSVSIDLYSLSDISIKTLYLKLQRIIDGDCQYAVVNGETIETAISTDNLQRVSSLTSYSKQSGLRKLSFKEFIILERHIARSGVYRYLPPLPLGSIRL